MREKKKINLNKVGSMVFIVVCLFVLAVPFWLYFDYITQFPEHCSTEAIGVLIIGLLLGVFLYLFIANLLLNNIDFQLAEIRKKRGVQHTPLFEKVRK